LREAGAPELEEAEPGVLARRLGADVPFFLRPEPSYATGVGDELEGLPLPALALVLLTSAEGLSTAAVYRALDELRAGDPSGEEGQAAFLARVQAAKAAWSALSRDWRPGPRQPAWLARLATLLENDLERGAFSLRPGLAHRREVSLAAGVPRPLAGFLSGSGPTLGLLCRSRPSAQALAAALEARGLEAQVATANPSSAGSRGEEHPDVRSS
jgi:4-diphosphocytidyl-2-C-methyl-D-erythritol kinase